MSTNPDPQPQGWRDHILSQPDVILEDKDVMRALVAANERTMGGNVVDMRGIAMERLEARLGKLEETHASVIAAAYENLAGTAMIHRAVLHLLEPADLAGFLVALARPVTDMLRIEGLKLILEAESDAELAALTGLDDVLVLAPKGFVEGYVGHRKGAPVRRVTLRSVDAGEPQIHGHRAADIRSEACLRLDLGNDRLPAMLVLGSVEPDHFAPSHGTDLMAFLAGAIERVLQRLLP